MTDDEVAGYVGPQFEGYVQERVAAGERPDAARKIADEQMRTLFPDGRPAPGHLLYRVLDDDGAPHGSLWMGPRRPDEAESFWVWNVEIDEAHRGRGLGRAAMLLAEAEARAHGASELGLNVFGANSVARQLYQSIGYETTAVNMRKRL